MRLTITGYPLAEPVVIDGAEPDDTIFGTGWLIAQPQAEAVITAWADAPTGLAPDGADDVRRAWHYSPLGVFVTALHLDGELGLSEWESAIGSEGDDRYSTTQMPFDFDIAATDH
ncbi:MAG: hypothetical protein CMH34_11620 [Microbacterium sp.]|nr:hypothetical protein [Microbacterium sp.]